MKSLTHIPDSDLEKLKQELEEQLPKTFTAGDSVCIKIHFGEINNPNHVRPEIAKTIVSVLNEIGTKPFLFDSLTHYTSPRKNPITHKLLAAKHGFTEKNIGCPIIIGNNKDFVEVKTENLNAEVCKALYEADGMIVLSHVKGHASAGFGGSIKNLGMGGLTSKSKWDIHSFAHPVLSGECVGCGICVKICPNKIIELKDSKFHVKDYKKCYGCDMCIIACPQKALKPRVELFDKLLAEGASAVIKNKKKLFYINVLEKIAKTCDCEAYAVPLATKNNYGFLLGKDIVAIDNASVDIINKNEGKNLFKEVTGKEPKLHIAYAELLEMGKQEYKLRKI